MRRSSSATPVDDADPVVRILRTVVLHLICAGMLVAAVATADPYWHNMAMAFAAGAFVLAWVPLD